MEAAAVEVGLSLAEYYSLTPRRFQSVFDRYVQTEIRRGHAQGTGRQAARAIPSSPDPQSMLTMLQALPMGRVGRWGSLNGGEVKPDPMADAMLLQTIRQQAGVSDRDNMTLSPHLEKALKFKASQ